MKKILLLATVTVLLCAMALSLVSCTLYSVSQYEAEMYITKFFAAMDTKSYAEAEGYLHPDHKVDLAAAMAKIPAKFHGKFEITGSTFATSTYQSGGTDGGYYEASYVRAFGDRYATITITIISNANGIGVGAFSIDPHESTSSQENMV